MESGAGDRVEAADGQDKRDADSSQDRGDRDEQRDRRERDDRGGRGERSDRPSRDNRGDRDSRDNRGDRRDRRDDRPRAKRPVTLEEQDAALARGLLEAPELPEDIEFSDLDEEVRRELRTLPKGLAETVGKHLVAAGGLVDSDPEAALEHARYAKTKASRVPIVREGLGLVAYHAGDWQEALSELRAVRRMTRSDEHIAIIADAERALGRPERALDLAKETDKERLTKSTQVELAIVAAGARRDLGQLDAAVVSLQGPDLQAGKRDPWSARLFYAYADNLEAAGRKEEAVQWFLNAAEADAEDETDAAERAADLANEANATETNEPSEPSETDD
ncbi:TPR-repeat-containing protein [Streptomyces sp. AA4]|nr:TPR-repeat-containing protein [Streptomyces sp. AA4]